MLFEQRNIGSDAFKDRYQLSFLALGIAIQRLFQLVYKASPPFVGIFQRVDLGINLTFLLHGQQAKEQIFLFGMVVLVGEVAGKFDSFFKKFSWGPFPSLNFLNREMEVVQELAD
jgi:hypothetical protein